METETYTAVNHTRALSGVTENLVDGVPQRTHRGAHNDSAMEAETGTARKSMQELGISSEGMEG